MRVSKGSLLVLLGCSQALAASQGAEIIFRGNFENGDSCAWSGHLGGSDVCPCGNLTLLQDSFDTAGAEPYFHGWHDAGTSLTESGGQVVIDIGANVNGYAGYVSSFFYDLHGGAIDTSVDEVAGAQTVLEVRNHLGDAAQIVQEGNEIIAATTSAGPLASRAWNPAEKYWRISEDHGELVWSVSSDRQSWDELHRMALPFDVAHVKGALFAGGLSPSPSQARFDDVNAGQPLGGFCDIDSLHDDFAAPPLLPPWQPSSGPGCSHSETGGQLVFTYTVGIAGTHWCVVESLHFYDLSRGGGITVDSTGLPSMANFISLLRAYLPNSNASGFNFLETTLENGTLSYRLWANGGIADESSLAFDAKLHRYWRMRGQGATAIFETSDGTGFIERWRVTAPSQLKPVLLGIAGYYDPATAPLTVTLPGVNAD